MNFELIMQEQWSNYRLSEILIIIGGGTPKTTNPEYWNGDIPWLSVADFNSGYRYVHTTEKTITPKALQESSTTLLRKGQLIISARGTVGVIAQLGRDMAFNQSCYGITAKEQVTTNNFLFYLLNNEVLLLKQITHGAVFDTITRETFDQISVNLPPLPTQHTIANILGSLDDKIELNRQMNETLEAMARAIFQSWFVDFDPVRAKAEGRDTWLPPDVVVLFPDRFENVGGREVPRGWVVATLGDYIEPIKGLSYKGEGLCDNGIPLHNLNSVLEGGGYKYPGIKFYNGEYKERHIILPGDVIVTNTEQGFDFLLIGYPAIVPKYFGEMGLFTHHLFRVRPKKQSPLTNHFIYHLLMAPLIREQVIGCTNGTTVNMMYVDGLKTPTFVLPSTEIIQMFEKIVSPMFEIMENYEQQSRTLAQIRDALLPKLMNGDR